jgi:hypothetical protein
MVHPDGLLWYRGYSEWSDDEGTAQLEQLLESCDVEHIVVGHTPQLAGAIRARFDDRLYLADTGMLSSYYTGGRASMLEIRDGGFRALYLDDGARLMRPEQSPGAIRSGADIDRREALRLDLGLIPSAIPAL